MKITPSHRVYGLGTILLVSLTICSRKFSSIGSVFERYAIVSRNDIADAMLLLQNSEKVKDPQIGHIIGHSAPLIAQAFEEFAS